MRDCLITIGFSAHHIEVLPFFRRQMERHRVIVLEEPPSANFSLMLDSRLSIDDYIMELDSQFPHFDRHMCELLREFHAEGRHILQVEPYLEMLLEIHQLFAAGKTKDDVMDLAGLREVYMAERNATGALLAYYASSTRAPFAQVVEAVKAFARADAKRLTFRERLRAQVIASLLQDAQSVFIEAGYIHFPLYTYLNRELGSHKIHKKICVVHLLGPVIKSLSGRRRNLGPGDILTLHYAFHRDLKRVCADLLAARSLIYIKLIEKDELIPGASTAPHAEGEIRINAMVDRLSFEDCEMIFDRIRFAGRKQALYLVEEYLGF
jgi:hypothetical protein